MTTATGTVLGGHLLHVAIYGGSLLVVGGVLGAVHLRVWLRERRRRVHDTRGLLRRGMVSRSGLVQAAFLGLCTAAVTHLAVMPDHFRESWLYGSFFLCVVIGQLSFAGVVLLRPSRAVLLAAVAESMVIVAVWTASRFIGVPVGPDHGAVESIGVLDVLATLAELVTAASCLAALWRDAARPAWRWSAWSPALRLALLTTSIGVPLAATLAPKG